MGNHWNNVGDLVIEEKTLFRPVGWLIQSPEGPVFAQELPTSKRLHGMTRTPVYAQIATWDGEGWKD